MVDVGRMQTEIPEPDDFAISPSELDALAHVFDQTWGLDKAPRTQLRAGLRIAALYVSAHDRDEDAVALCRLEALLRAVFLEVTELKQHPKHVNQKWIQCYVPIGKWTWQWHLTKRDETVMELKMARRALEVFRKTLEENPTGNRTMSWIKLGCLLVQETERAVRYGRNASLN